MPKILEKLGIEASAQSLDYVQNMQQFQLHHLLTEQRHPSTKQLGEVAAESAEQALRMLFAVDDDVSSKLNALRADVSLLEQASASVARAVGDQRRIFVYGCGATGRLAKQIDSSLWRPFWRKLKEGTLWDRVRARVGDDIECRLIGEMTGADRALVSSLEGFEDLPLIGELQLQDHGIEPGDVVLAVTEGGETSSVIGAVLAAANAYGSAQAECAREQVYLLFNNPEALLLPLDRSRAALEHPGITKIQLATGPQAITGSTRMQATTIGTFVVGVIVEEALAKILKTCLSASELRALGFKPEWGVSERLQSFSAIKSGIDAAIFECARLTQLEAETYSAGASANYFADSATLAVFIDAAERSPTFRLYPLDAVDERRAWVRVWTNAATATEAWWRLLGRPFRGLEVSRYRAKLAQDVHDGYLRRTALASLERAGAEQEYNYDFALSSHNQERYAPGPGDLGVLVLIDDEAYSLADESSGLSRFVRLFAGDEVRIAALIIAADARQPAAFVERRLGGCVTIVPVSIGDAPDPQKLRRQLAVKMILNAHSTAVMASLGRVVKNTMTSVSPSNLKLIGRATHLVMLHVNDILERRGRQAASEASRISYAEANAVLFDAMDYVRAAGHGQLSEVALSIIRILEAFRRNETASWDASLEILDEMGLAAYLRTQATL